MELCISAFGPSITEQCQAAGVEATGMPMELVERISKAITLCHIQGMLTPTECDRARIRLIKQAKFREIVTEAGSA